MVKRRTIMVTPETHQRLEQLGKFGDTFDDVIGKLIDYYYEKEGQGARLTD